MLGRVLMSHMRVVAQGLMMRARWSRSRPNLRISRRCSSALEYPSHSRMRELWNSKGNAAADGYRCSATAGFQAGRQSCHQL